MLDHYITKALFSILILSFNKHAYPAGVSRTPNLSLSNIGIILQAIALPLSYSGIEVFKAI